MRLCSVLKVSIAIHVCVHLPDRKGQCMWHARYCDRPHVHMLGHGIWLQSCRMDMLLCMATSAFTAYQVSTELKRKAAQLRSNRDLLLVNVQGSRILQCVP